jgi:hypothetical protein
MRAPVDTIPAPPFPAKLPWVNVAPLRMDKQIGRPVLIEFWDFCRVNSLRTLPYISAWHERYAADGLRVIGIHDPGFAPSRDEDAVREACKRLAVTHPVLIDVEHRMWIAYDNKGWPARYLFDQRGMLFDYHLGEGGYADTERAIQELLGVERDLVQPVRPEDDPEALIVGQTPDQPGAYSGPYAAGGVWAVVEGGGEVRVNGEPLRVTHPGAYPLLQHERHTEGVVEIVAGDGVTCHATCFTPGLAPA